MHLYVPPIRVPCTERGMPDACAGAIFGLGGALAVYAARHRKIMPGKSGDNLLRSLGQTLAINVVYGLTSPRIDQWCVTGSGTAGSPSRSGCIAAGLIR